MEPLRASDAYDRVRYPSHAFPQTHPDRLCAVARLHGLEAAAPERCRYLELGCGSGHNLLAMAMLLPQSRFLGIDLAAGPIQEAQRHAQELQLTGHLEFRQGDIAALADPGHPDLGEFDYIVAHGVFSWVPEAVRTALLRLIQRHLSREGVAFISYNTYPGCHLRQLLRHMLRYHVQDLPEEQRIEQGRALVQVVLDAKAGPPAYGPILQAELTHLQQADPGLIHHDDLADINQPFYLHEFLALASAHGLQFLGEANLHEMQARTFPPEVVQMLQALSTEQREQYIDFLRCRRFRQTLLVHQGRSIDRDHPGDHLAGLALASDAHEEAPPPPSPISQARGGYEVRFVRGQARTTVRSLVARTALAELSAAWPHTRTFAGLLALVRAHPGCAEASEEEIMTLLLETVSIGMVDVRAAPVPCAERVSSHPRASRLARWQLAHGSAITSLRHTSLRTEGQLTPLLVSLCDGSRDHQALAAALIAAIAAGRLHPPGGVDPSDPSHAERMHTAVAKHLGAALDHLHRLALLEA